MAYCVYLYAQAWAQHVQIYACVGACMQCEARVPSEGHYDQELPGTQSGPGGAHCVEELLHVPNHLVVPGTTSPIVNLVREVVKYYFADFVRKGGTPPPPLRTKFSPKNKLRIWGVPPLPPLRTFPRKMFFKKC